MHAVYAIERMDKLLNDPHVMQQCAKLLADPGIMKQMGELLNHPEKVASLTEMLLNAKPSTDGPVDGPAAKHPSGTRVVVDGLAKHDLNGRVGVVVSHDASTDRYTVRLDEPASGESRQIAVKAPHCTALDDDASSSAQPVEQ